MQIITDTQKLIEKMQLFDKKKGKFIFFKLWKAQLDILYLLHTVKRIIILKKRQVGASQLSGADSLAQCMILDNFTVLVLSKTGPDAKEFLKRVRDMYHSLPKQFKDASVIVKDNLEELEFANGSRILSLPANRGAGFTADRVIIDEAAFITKTDAKVDLSVTLQRVAPTLDKSGGQLILISTANGKNLFEKVFKKAERKLSNWVSYFFSCWADPTFTEQDRQDIVDEFGEDHANQEYPRTAEEAFISSGSPRFDAKALEEYMQNRLIKSKLRANINNKGEIEENSKGYINFYYQKDITGQYIIVADVAEGLDHGDYSVAKVICLFTGKQIAEWHGHIEHKEFGTELVKLGRHYNNAILIVESNNHGHSTITQIRNETYSDELIFEGSYAKEAGDDAFKNPEKRYGWQTTSKTKKIIVDNLAQMLVKREIPILTYEDYSELSTYVRENGKTNAEEGCFDDRVICLSIAYYVIDYIEIKRLLPFEVCGNCTHQSKGRCGLTDKVINREGNCRLFREIDMSTPKELLKNRRYTSRRKRHS